MLVWRVTCAKYIISTCIEWLHVYSHFVCTLMTAFHVTAVLLCPVPSLLQPVSGDSRQDWLSWIIQYRYNCVEEVPAADNENSSYWHLLVVDDRCTSVLMLSMALVQGQHSSTIAFDFDRILSCMTRIDVSLNVTCYSAQIWYGSQCVDCLGSRNATAIDKHCKTVPGEMHVPLFF